MAKSIFKVNMQLYPESAHVYDSYAEACMLNKEYEPAIKHYHKSLELKPKNQNAQNMIKKMQILIRGHAEHFTSRALLESQLASLVQYLHVSEVIEDFWLNPENQKSSTWSEHIDINSVMLATSLLPIIS